MSAEALYDGSKQFLPKIKSITSQKLQSILKNEEQVVELPSGNVPVPLTLEDIKKVNNVPKVKKAKSKPAKSKPLQVKTKQKQVECETEQEVEDLVSQTLSEDSKATAKYVLDRINSDPNGRLYIIPAPDSIWVKIRKAQFELLKHEASKPLPIRYQNMSDIQLLKEKLRRLWDPYTKVLPTVSDFIAAGMGIQDAVAAFGEDLATWADLLHLRLAAYHLCRKTGWFEIEFMVKKYHISGYNLCHDVGVSIDQLISQGITLNELKLLKLDAKALIDLGITKCQFINLKFTLEQWITNLDFDPRIHMCNNLDFDLEDLKHLVYTSKWNLDILVKRYGFNIPLVFPKGSGKGKKGLPLPQTVTVPSYIPEVIPPAYFAPVETNLVEHDSYSTLSMDYFQPVMEDNNYSPSGLTFDNINLDFNPNCVPVLPKAKLKDFEINLDGLMGNLNLSPAKPVGLPDSVFGNLYISNMKGRIN